MQKILVLGKNGQLAQAIDQNRGPWKYEFLDKDDIDLSNLFMWSEEEFLKKTQGSPIRRAGYESWLRNIAIALGNAESSVEVLRVLHSKKDDPSEIVKEHVNWAIEQHKNKEKK